MIADAILESAYAENRQGDRLVAHVWQLHYKGSRPEVRATIQAKR